MGTDEQTDWELVRSVLSGNSRAYEVLVRRYQDSVFGLAVSLTRNREDAADMAQEAFIRAYEKLEQYNPDYSFRSWVLRICANRSKNLFRSRMRKRQTEERHLAQREIAEEGVAPDFEELEAALEAIPSKLSAPLRLKYMEELSYEEVARILGIGVSAAKMRVSRAKKQLADMLKK